MSELCPNWKEEFIQTGFELLDSALLLPISAMLTLALKSNTLLACYTHLDFLPSKSLENVTAPIIKQGLLTQNKEHPAGGTHTCLLALAGMEPGECLAIEHDKAVSFPTFLITWIQYVFIERALAKQPLPSMAILALQNSGLAFELPAHFAFSKQSANRTMAQFTDIFKQQFFADQFTGLPLTAEYMAAYIHEALDFTYQQYEHGLGLIQAYRDKLAFDLEAKIQILQKQDEALEQRYQSLLAAQTDLASDTSKSFLGQLWQKLAQNKSKNRVKNLEKLSQHLVLEASEESVVKSSKNMLEWIGDNLRKIQVDRTKLHAELIGLSEAHIEKQGQWLKLLTWQKEHTLTLFSDQNSADLADDFPAIRDYFGEKLFELANLYWQAQQHVGMIFMCDFSYQNPYEKWVKQHSVDYLFVFQANYFSPMMGAEFCSHAKRIIGFAATKALSVPVLTPLQDTWLTRRNKLTHDNPESLLEEMGVLVSTGEAFQVIKTHSVYEDPAYPGMGYTQSFYLGLDKPAELNLARIDFQPIVGKLLADRGSFMNPAEAQSLFNWVTSQQIQEEDVLIVTAFTAQYYYLCLLFKGLPIQVCSLRGAMGKRAKWVVVSMVNTSESFGPTIYDQNPLLLPEISQMAEERLVIFADPGIFALNHTTLGKFAHKVLARTPDQKKDILFAS
jgi:hypothetical protein